MWPVKVEANYLSTLAQDRFERYDDRWWTLWKWGLSLPGHRTRLPGFFLCRWVYACRHRYDFSKNVTPGRRYGERQRGRLV